MNETKTQTEKVTVRIQTSQRVRFNQTVEMTREEWEEIKKTPESEMEDFQMSPIAGWLDLNDVDDCEEFESPEIQVIDSDGKVIDEYDPDADYQKDVEEEE